jgi:hypothetical protein
MASASTRSTTGRGRQGGDGRTLTYPRRSLVSNIGRDGTGSHGDVSGTDDRPASDDMPLDLPQPRIDARALRAVRGHLRAQRSPLRRLGRRVARLMA